MVRLLLAAGISLFVSLFGTKAAITWLTRRHVGQPIQSDGPQEHLKKQGTPTMGGVAMVAAAFAGYVVSDLYHGVYTRTGLITMFTIAAAGGVGMLDDWTKVSTHRNLGLRAGQKFGLLALVAFGFAVAMINLTDVDTELSFTRYNNFNLNLGPIGWTIWAMLLILATSNAVNLTDGLDGLASGSTLLCYSAFVAIAYWVFRHPDIYEVPHALDLAVIAAGMGAASAGFLWWNAHPAQIMMGDTGSLALGTGLAVLALTTNTQLLLLILGGIFVIETLSVIIQVVSFKVRHKRVFKMAPIHHHFELLGWAETKVTIRFWLICGMFVALALAMFYGDYVLVTGTGAGR